MPGSTYPAQKIPSNPVVPLLSLTISIPLNIIVDVIVDVMVDVIVDVIVDPFLNFILSFLEPALLPYTESNFLIVLVLPFCLILCPFLPIF